jgi:hypothetical protein
LRCQELLQQTTSSGDSGYGGPEWQECAEHKAERILAEELARRGWGTEQLAQLRKADAEKLRIAKRLRAETTMTLDWIAQRLQAGAPGYLANCLRQEGRQNMRMCGTDPFMKAAWQFRSWFVEFGMNTFAKYPTRWRRFVQVGLMLVLGCLGTSYSIAVHVLRAEAAKASVMVLAGGLFWIALLLWGLLFLQMMAFLNTKCRGA